MLLPIVTLAKKTNKTQTLFCPKKLNIISDKIGKSSLLNSMILFALIFLVYTLNYTNNTINKTIALEGCYYCVIILVQR
jgi:ascorbate-specific PTS system EIIC-type component UlaA